MASEKLFPSAEAALAGVVADGQTLAVGGFGLCGIPEALIAAFEAAADRGVVTFEGRMVDKPVVERARRVLRRHEAVAVLVAGLSAGARAIPAAVLSRLAHVAPPDGGEVDRLRVMLPDIFHFHGQ